MYREGGSRAFWVGFALFGGLHLVYPTVIGLQPTQVITTRISHHIYDWLYSEPPIPPGAPGWGIGPSSGMSTPGGPDMYSSGASGYPGSMGSSDGSTGSGYGSAGGMPGATGMGGMMGGAGGAAIRPFTGPTLDNFTSVAHTLWMLLLALCGGWLAQWLYATRRRSSDRQESR
jgi:hypothetical protein